MVDERNTIQRGLASGRCEFNWKNKKGIVRIGNPHRIENLASPIFSPKLALIP